VTGKLVIELLFLNWIVIAAGIGSLILYWTCVLLLNVSVIAQLFQPNIEGVYFQIFSTPSSLISLFLIPLLALIPDMTIKYFSMMYFQTKSDEIIQKVRANRHTKMEDQNTSKAKTKTWTTFQKTQVTIIRSNVTLELENL